MKVYLAQLKCPNNHCTIGCAGEFESLEAAQALKARVQEWFAVLVASRTLNNECGLCHSTDFHVEIAPTVFKTMEEFQPVAREEEARQMALADHLRHSRN
jgi:hypothetical protein